MQVSTKKILSVVLLMTILLLSSHGLAQEQSQGEQISVLKGESPAAAPDLADIIPAATQLSGRLVTLEKLVTGVLDVPALEAKYTEVKNDLTTLENQFQRIKKSKNYRYHKYVELKEEIEQEKELFEKISEPLSQAIRQLGTWRKEWLAERKRWHEWQSSLLKEGELDLLKSTFEKANSTIDPALDLVLQQLEALLAVQEKAGTIDAKLIAVAAELDVLIMDERRGTLLTASPPMFSSQYFSQFSSELWDAMLNDLDEISWPGNRFFTRQGWIVLLQGFLSIFVIITIHRNRRVLNESKRWCFLAARPFSAGLFLGCMTTVLIYAYMGAPAICKLVNLIVCGISFARLSGCLLETSWKKKFVYGLMIVLILIRLMDVLSFPLPLFRLFTVSTALTGLILCLRWARESRRHKDLALYSWLLSLGSLIFTVIIFLELWGKSALALYLFVSLIDSIATVVVFMLFIYLIHGSLEWLFRTSPLRRAAVIPSDETDAIIQRVAHFIDIAIWGLILLPAILMIWGVYDSLKGATTGLLAIGFNLGSQRISLGLLLVSAGILYGSFLISWILQKMLMDEVLVKRRVERGVRHSIARLVHYVLISVGFLIALATLGVEVTKITIILSALGVGIGFGLQGVVNNFVSGLILLFERPIRVGDTIQLGGKWAEIKRISLRSTRVQTFDQADVIIPNADLINNQVTNWTLSNRQVRVTITVGVAYGSDVPLVMETLIACAKSNSKVAKIPASQVLFLSFGESSLDFELRVWVWDADHRLEVKSELHQEIDRSFREAKIEIAFPQRDLHLRSLDESVLLQHSKTTM